MIASSSFAKKLGLVRVERLDAVVTAESEFAAFAFDDHWVGAKWSVGHDAMGERIGVGGEGGSGDKNDRETDECCMSE